MTRYWVTLLIVPLVACSSDSKIPERQKQISLNDQPAKKAVVDSQSIADKVAPSPKTLSDIIAKELSQDWKFSGSDTRFSFARAVHFSPSSSHVPISSPATFSINITVLENLDSTKQRQMIDDVDAEERRLWKTVKNLECKEKSFSDRYIDGLCFRAPKDAQSKKVSLYRQALEKKKNLPRFRFGDDGIGIRERSTLNDSGGSTELGTISCEDCDESVTKVKSLMKQNF